MLHFEGEKELQASPEAVWARLGDARFLVECIPGVEKITLAEADKASCVVRPGFAFVRGTLELAVRVLEKAQDRSVRLEVDSKGIGSSSTVETFLTLVPRDGGTTLKWSASVLRLGGLLKAVPSGLIKGAAQKIINDVWAVLDAKMQKT